MQIMDDPRQAVRFGESVDTLGETNKAFPFWYNFIPDEDDPSESTDYLGVTVPANSVREHFVKIDPDYTFKLLWFKYSVYRPPSLQVAHYRWYDDTASVKRTSDYQLFLGTPFTKYIDITVSYRPQGSFLYGGINTDPTLVTAMGTNPIEVHTLQGYDYGYGQLRTPVLLPREATVAFTIHNTADANLIIAGCMFGMKVRV